MECISEEEGVMRCRSNHYFHEGCMRRWLRTQRGATCPLCRGPVQVHAPVRPGVAQGVERAGIVRVQCQHPFQVRFHALILAQAAGPSTSPVTLTQQAHHT